MTISDHQAAVIGAGPYGLAAAAHLRAANVTVAHFGRAMEFWKNQMPAGMLLRSPWDASHIGDPRGRLSLDQYQGLRGADRNKPVSLASFVAYGEWFQERTSPELDGRQVVEISREGRGFRLSLEDGEQRHVGRVIVATGIASFAHRPSIFDHAPLQLASHSSDHRDLAQFRGKKVAVVGRGQSALESAALLCENGAEVELIVRASKIRWLHAREILRHPMNPLRTLFFHPTDVGPALLTQISARPEWFKLLPAALQPSFAYRCIRPAGAAWLKDRVGSVRITMGRQIVAADPVGGSLRLRMDDGSDRSVDHVLLATGYRVDILRHAFLGPLAEQIRCNQGYPELAEGFESSVPGLHFLGAPAAVDYGPLMRFVSGTAYSAAALTRQVAGGATSNARSRGRRWLMSYSEEP